MITIFDEDDARDVLAELEQGKSYEEIFSRYPRFAFHEFQELLAKNAALKRLHANVLKFRAHKDRDRIRALADTCPDKDDAPGTRLQFDVLKHLSSQGDPSMGAFAGEEDGVAAHMVVFIPKRQPPGVAAAQVEAIEAEVVDDDRGEQPERILEAGDEGPR